MIQRGRNDKYPEKIETWKKGQRVPEWLSDRAKIELVDLGNEDKILKMTNLSSGGYELYDASGKNVLTRVPEENGYVCFGDSKIFSLSQRELELLYTEEEKKRKRGLW